jgi:hypothetical protein
LGVKEETRHEASHEAAWIDGEASCNTFSNLGE